MKSLRMKAKNLLKYSLTMITLLTCFFQYAVYGQIKSDTTYLNNEKTIYTVNQRDAYPIEGMVFFDNWNEENFKKELKTSDKEEKRKIYIEFVVGVDGTLSDFKLLKGLGEPYDPEALRVVQANPTKWRPGRVGSKPIRQKFIVVIRI